MYQYAGTEFRSSYIEEAVSEIDARNAVPLNDRMLPKSKIPGGIHPFSIKPSYAFSRLMKKLETTSNILAKNYLNSSPDLDFFGINSSDSYVKNPRYSTPFRTKVKSIRCKFENYGLDKLHGLVLMPLWICEYSYFGTTYRAFVNGASMNSNVVGVTHRSPILSTAGGALCGLVGSGVPIVITKNILFFLLMPFTTIIGGVMGIYFGMYN